MAENRDVLNDGFIDDTFDDIKPMETEGKIIYATLWYNWRQAHKFYTK